MKKLLKHLVKEESDSFIKYLSLADQLEAAGVSRTIINEVKKAADDEAAHAFLFQKILEWI